MTEETRCPSCGASLVIDAGLRGQEFHCSYCGTAFVIPRSPGEVARPVVPPKPAEPETPGWPFDGTDLARPATPPEEIIPEPPAAAPQPPAPEPEPEPEPPVEASIEPTFELREEPPVEAEVKPPPLPGKAEPTESETYTLDQPADASTGPEPVRAEVDTSGEMVSCPLCGKGIWVVSEQRGQSMQCPHCGRALTVPPSLEAFRRWPTPHPPAGRHEIPDYLPLAILMLLCCFPFAIPAIYHAVEANQAKTAARYADAAAAAEKAKGWCVAAGICSGLAFVWWFLAHAH